MRRKIPRPEEFGPEPLGPDPFGFGDCEARHRRAREHLAYLQPIIERLSGKTNPLNLGPRPDPVDEAERATRRQETPYLRYRGGEWILGTDVSVRLGEFIYNLRSVLDYLVYSLAWRDSGRPQDGTQFLIEDREEVFLSKRPSRLKGISDEHVAVLSEYQRTTDASGRGGCAT